MSCKLEPPIWSRDSGQRIPCFDRCQLIITWMSNIKEVYGKPMLHVSVNLLFEVWPPQCTTPSPSCLRAMPLAMITMRKSTHGFPFLSYMRMGLRLAALRIPRVPLITVRGNLQVKVTGITLILNTQCHGFCIILESCVLKARAVRHQSIPLIERL